MGKHAVIAIDGPSGSGKSTIARRLAEHLGFTLLDTGALYRCVALGARRAGIAWDDGARLATLAATLNIEFSHEGGVNRVLVDGRDVTREIREPEISDGASLVSRLPEVRRALLDLQREFAERGPVVAEGRDVTTVVFSDAPLKVFLDADADLRARRRYQELRDAGRAVEFDDVRRAEEARDRADSTRQVAPLRLAEDAVQIDTSTLSVGEVVDLILDECRARGIASAEGSATVGRTTWSRE